SGGPGHRLRRRGVAGGGDAAGVAGGPAPLRPDRARPADRGRAGPAAGGGAAPPAAAGAAQAGVGTPRGRLGTRVGGAAALGVGGFAGAQVGGWSLRAVALGAVVLVPAAIAAVAAAAVSTLRSVYGSGSLLAFSPESTGLGLVIREGLPPAIATTGVVTVWAA